MQLLMDSCEWADANGQVTKKLLKGLFFWQV